MTIIAIIAIAAAAAIEYNHRQTENDLTAMIGRMIEAHEAGA